MWRKEPSQGKTPSVSCKGLQGLKGQRLNLKCKGYPKAR